MIRHPAACLSVLLVAWATGCSREPSKQQAEPARPAPEAKAGPSVRFAGFGPADFGAGVEAVRKAVGRTLVEGPPIEGSTCRYLYLAPEGEAGPPYPLAFMFVDGAFVRLDIHGADTTAPGGGRVGMSEREIGHRYAGRLVARPHKYTDGKYLIASPPPRQGGESRLVFETDAAGTVTQWRVGLPPPVHWAEGCA